MSYPSLIRPAGFQFYHVKKPRVDRSIRRRSQIRTVLNGWLRFMPNAPVTAWR